MAIQTSDFLVVGGGIIGLALALEARRRHPDLRVLLIEKEPACGRHASGKNSGVLHAGFYYASDSLKARFTRDGNRELTEYCLERGVRINRCGKLILARDESDWPGLDELLGRARANDVELHEVTAAEAREIEPAARTFERALYSPTTSSVDPREVVDSLVRDARDAGVEVITGRGYVRRDGETVHTTQGAVSAGYVINAAGLYADRIARDFGFSADHRILPFKGLYLQGNESAGRSFRSHLYPMPNLQYPFLGVHITVTAHGHAKLGPTALPAFWRENYAGLRGFRLSEFLEILRLQSGLLLRNELAFRTFASREIRKRSKARLLKEASELVSGLPGPESWRWGEPGLRAQLFNVRTRRLETDFRYEGDERSFHVLNAVSPAFTCAIPFARYLFDEIDRLLAQGARRGGPVGRVRDAGRVPVPRAAPAGGAGRQSWRRRE